MILDDDYQGQDYVLKVNFLDIVGNGRIKYFILQTSAYLKSNWGHKLASMTIKIKIAGFQSKCEY